MLTRPTLALERHENLRAAFIDHAEICVEAGEMYGVVALQVLEPEGEGAVVDQ